MLGLSCIRRWRIWTSALNDFGFQPNSANQMDHRLHGPDAEAKSVWRTNKSALNIQTRRKPSPQPKDFFLTIHSMQVCFQVTHQCKPAEWPFECQARLWGHILPKKPLCSSCELSVQPCGWVGDWVSKTDLRPFVAETVGRWGGKGQHLLQDGDT